TMRQWSEEQQTGTLEILLTLPVRAWQLVLGKFLAVMVLVAITLALTLFLPISVAIMGDLDWGPVIGGYLAALLLAAAYTAIGLFISSRTNNQIVALILSVVLCGLFYFIGNRSLTEFFGESVGDVLRLLSTNSRFESIERGVIDLRDLVYYITLAVVFLALNVLSLDSKRWSIGAHTANYRTNANLAVGLLTVNALLLNVWLQPVTALRADLTQSKEYSLSTTTKDLINNLQEPLLIRAYFSERTHPLLAPLVPRIRDMLTEYQVASHGKVMVEVVDPAQNPDLEAEAAQSYGIRPTPFQIAGRYESSVVNAYFDILVRYGDKSEVLNFRDLIEVEPFRDGTLDVRLRNLEYDLTRTIKKVVYGFQSIDAVLAALTDPAVLTLYVTPDTLPEEFATVPDTVQKVATELETQSNGKFSLKIVNPD
ncbi:MAG: Gldg family protein, partial [Caldilineaceae bacterium]|nr:Gldg family protein [Caldilineaceae bacterium]